MLYYNTAMPSLILPEYGRHIQQMVDFCLSIEDREERTICAHAIVDVMANMFPQNKDIKKYWDHLNIMSGFKLDIDFPVEVITQEELHPETRKIPYKLSNFRFRHYGKYIEEMIKVVSDMEEGEEKEELISMIAHHLKKLTILHNPEGLNDAKILRDIYEYSDGKIRLDPETYILRDFMEIKEPVVTQKKKKKK